MLSKRIIPCLDVKDGQTVKGVNFQDLKYAGDPVALAEKYADEGADELVFLDITATNEARQTMLDVVEKVARRVFIPFTVGGGIKSVQDITNLLHAGADKISLNTQAVLKPELIAEASAHFGSQCVVVAIDAKKFGNDYIVVTNAGTKKTDLNVLDWAKKVTALGAGEILLTSMDADGMQNGFDLEVTALVSKNVSVPVIASGGAGADPMHFADVFVKGSADAALAASVFHYGKLPIPELKRKLTQQGLVIRS